MHRIFLVLLGSTGLLLPGCSARFLEPYAIATDTPPPADLEEIRIGDIEPAAASELPLHFSARLRPPQEPLQVAQRATDELQPPAQAAPAPADTEPLFEEPQPERWTDAITPIAEVDVDITPPEGLLPENVMPEELIPSVPDGPLTEEVGRPEIVYSWVPWTICYRPLYFEQIGPERYGTSHGILQPVISGAHFFGTIPLLPYDMVVHPPRSCVCTNGYSRHGDYVVRNTYDPIWRWDAALVETGFIAGMILLFP